MGNLSSVFRKWKQHVSSDIHSSASMKFDSNGVPVKSTTNFHIVGDLDGATECYITAHGGCLDGDYFFDNKSFTIPDGVTVHFYQPHGYILGFGSAALRNGNPKGHGGTTDQEYSGGEECPNYILTKDQGRHLSGDANYAAQWEMDYTSTQKLCGDLGIVMVIVRNRWFHAGVTLKAAISEVTKAAPSITTFNCLFCRVTDGSTADVWDAVNGAWT